MLPPACTECERELVRGAVQKLSQDQTGEQAAMLEKVVVERVRGMLRLPNAILQALPPPLAPPAPPSKVSTLIINNTITGLLRVQFPHRVKRLRL